MYYYLNLFFSSLDYTYLCCGSSLTQSTLPCCPLLTPRSLDFCHSLLIILSFFLPLSLPLLFFFHTLFSAWVFLVYTLSDRCHLSRFISTGRRANHLLMKQMASRCELPSQRAREAFGLRVVRTFEVDHLTGFSSFCAWKDKFSELYK